MAFCTNCGHQLADGAKFCSECGARVATISQETRRSVFDGTVHKCPSCGEVINSFEAFCPSCHLELRGSAHSGAVSTLSQKLEHINSYEERSQLIKTFYVPNTKEELTEFIILASSNLEVGDGCDDAWVTKLEQVYQKAKLSFNGGFELTYIEDQYNTALQKYKARMGKNRRNENLKKVATFIQTMIVGLFRMIWLIISSIFIGIAKGVGYVFTSIWKSKASKASILFITGLIMVLGSLLGTVFFAGSVIVVPFLFFGMIGLVPFLIGIIMLCLSDRKNKK
jgi:RNA polymerase subunit RPABC4/transcription elongation factor Spt4